MEQEKMCDLTKRLAKEVKDIVLDETGMDSDEIALDTKLLTSGLVDSFTFVSVLTLIETEYGIAIPQDELTLENFDTIQNIVALVDKYSPS
jgi:acyl carrier protein